MATGKKSFVLYADYINIFEELTDEEAGQLAKHMFRYVNDQHPEAENRLIKIAFEPIKQQLKRDLKEWEIVKESKSNSGRLGNLKRWNKDLFDLVIGESISLDEAENIARSRKTSHSDNNNRTSSHDVANIAVTVTDTVTVTDILSKDNNRKLPPQKPKLKKQPDALQFPFTGPEFLKAWNKLITLPKWKKKPLSAIQQSLDNISKYDEEFAVKQINDAHAGNWQGLTFPDTDEKFLKWKNQRNGKTSINNGNIRTNKNSETIAAAENLFRDIASEIRQ